jgi:hypothetical protein
MGKNTKNEDDEHNHRRSAVKDYYFIKHDRPE